MNSFKKLLLTATLLVAAPLFTHTSFEKIEETYTVSYGSPQSPIKITEYFSLSCPKCLHFIRTDFSEIKRKHIETGQVFWTFHPDPADLATLQAMVCFEQLTPPEKEIFLRQFVLKAPLSSSKMHTTMRHLMEIMGKLVGPLHDLSFLENTRAFKHAYSYIKQPQVPSNLPTIEVNGRIFEDFPTKKFITDIVARYIPLEENKGHLK